MANLTKVSKVDYLASIKKAMAAQQRYGEKIKFDKPKYHCSICKDKEFVFNQDIGRMVPCKCHAMRIVERRLAKAGISIEEYKKRSLVNFTEDRPEAKQMKSLALKFLAEHKQGEGLLYTGKSGTMKTTVCMAVCMELTRQGEEHRYFSYRDEMPILKWQMFNKADAYQEAIKKLIWCDNLFIDDLFKTKKSAIETKTNEYKLDATPTDVQIIYQLVNGRYLNKKTTIFSSEYPLRKIIEDIDEATGTRIFEMCKRFNMTCSDVNRRLMR